MYEYQRKALDQLVDKRMLCLRYGTGKSRIVLMRTREHVNSQHELFAIIFCRPRNIITWTLEIRKWLSSECRIYVGANGVSEILPCGHVISKKYGRRPSSDSILLIPHHRIDSLKDHLHSIIQNYHPSALILDESTAIKNPKTKVSKAAIELSNVARFFDCLTLCLTGKPMPETETEIWAQFAFAYGTDRSNHRLHPLDNTFYSFLNRWFIKSDWKWVLRSDKRDEFYHVVREYVAAFDDADVVEFDRACDTDVRYVIEHYTESPEQRRLLDHLYKHWSLPSDANGAHGELEYTYTLSLQSKSQQIAGGFYYYSYKRATHSNASIEWSDTFTLKANPKLQLLVEVVQQLLEEEPQRRIIVWRRFIAEDDIICNGLAKAGVSYVVGPSEENLKAFSAPEQSPSVIVMPCGVSQGFNELVGADTGIFYSNDYSQERRDQAEARIARLGQNARVVTHIDLCSPRLIDAEIVAALQSKSLTPERMETLMNQYIPTKELCTDEQG